MFALITLASAFYGNGLNADDSIINLNLPSECVDSVYVSGFGGVNFLQSFHRHRTRVNSDTGLIFGAAVGYRFENQIRVEAEFAYRNNGVRNFAVDSKKITNGERFSSHRNTRKHEKISGKRNTTYSYMANVYYDFAGISCEVSDYTFTPYLGVGIGYAHNRASGSPARNFETSVIDNGVAYQAMAGVTHHLNEKTLLGLEYKYFVAKHDIKDHSITVNVKRYF